MSIETVNEFIQGAVVVWLLIRELKHTKVELHLLERDTAFTDRANELTNRVNENDTNHCSLADKHNALADLAFDAVDKHNNLCEKSQNLHNSTARMIDQLQSQSIILEERIKAVEDFLCGRETALNEDIIEDFGGHEKESCK